MTPHDDRQAEALDALLHTPLDPPPTALPPDIVAAARALHHAAARMDPDPAFAARLDAQLRALPAHATPANLDRPRQRLGFLLRPLGQLAAVGLLALFAGGLALLLRGMSERSTGAATPPLLPASCIGRETDIATHVELVGDFCFAYPTQYFLSGVGTPQLLFAGETELLGGVAALTIRQEPAAGRTLQEFMDPLLALRSASEEMWVRSERPFAGTTAILREPRDPSTGLAGELFAIVGDTAFHLTHIPDPTGYRPDARLWEQVLGSLTPLPDGFTANYAACPKATEGFATFLNPREGFCFRYPSSAWLGYRDQVVLLFRPSTNLDHQTGLGMSILSSDFDVQASGSITETWPGAQTTLGVAAAWESPLPTDEEGLQRRLFAPHQSRVHTLSLYVIANDETEAATFVPQAEALWQEVTASWHWVPAALLPNVEPLMPTLEVPILDEALIAPEPTAVIVETPEPVGTPNPELPMPTAEAPEPTLEPEPTQAMPAPTAAPTLEPTLPVTELATAVGIRVIGWSLDEQWVAYWQYTTSHVGTGEAGTIVLHNVETGETCLPLNHYPVRDTFAPSVSPWLADGTFLYTTADGTLVRAQLCAKNIPVPLATGYFTLLARSADGAQVLMSADNGYWLYRVGAPAPHRISDELSHPGASFSPDGRYLALVTGLGPIRVTLIDTATATVGWTTALVAVEQSEPGTENYPNEAPIWLGNDRFLVPQSPEQGPVLVSVSGQVTPIASLFPKQTFEDPARLIAGAGWDPDTATYHLLLRASGATSLYYRTGWLYHSENARVEGVALPEEGVASLSPDGRTLLITSVQSEAWVRPGDTSTADLIPLPIPPSFVRGEWVWASDGTQMAAVTNDGLLIVPLNTPTTPVASLVPSAGELVWSPNSHSLAVVHSYEDTARLSVVRLP